MKRVLNREYWHFPHYTSKVVWYLRDNQKPSNHQSAAPAAVYDTINTTKHVENMETRESLSNGDKKN